MKTILTAIVLTGLAAGASPDAHAATTGGAMLAPMMAASDTPRANRKAQRRQNARREGTRTTTATDRKGRTAKRTTTRDVDEQNRSARTTRTTTGPNGRSATRTTDAARTDNGYTRDFEWVGPNGKTATRNAEGHWDAQTQTWSRDVAATGPNGQTASRNAATTRTDNGYSRSVERVGPQGGVATRDADGSWNAETQTWTRSASATGPNGDSRSLDVEAQRLENGAIRTATRTNAEGESLTRTQSVERTSDEDGDE